MYISTYVPALTEMTFVLESMLSWGAGVGTREYSSQSSVDPRGREKRERKKKKGEERKERKERRGEK